MIFSKVLLACSAVSCSFYVPLQPVTPEKIRNSDNNQILYSLGKKVLTGDVNLYIIYYGDSWTAFQQQLIEDFSSGLGASNWYKSTREYYYQASASSNKIYVNGALKVAKTVSASGPALSGTAIGDLIQSQVDKGAFPEDENGIYFVLSAPDVLETIRSDVGQASFCTDYCGYHITSLLKSGTRIQYGFAGNPSSQCPYSCIPQQNRFKSPNNDTGIDALLSAFAHEITEAVSDPISDIDSERAWNDSQGSENADKCAYKYGTISTDRVSGSKFNLEFGGRKYLIQQNWSPVKQICTM